MKRTKIVCTLGPSSQEKEILKELVKNGLNVARLNFSHGTHEENQKRIEMLREVTEELGIPVAVLLDTKGPEIRTGKFEKQEVLLNEGQEFILTTRDITGSNYMCSVSYEKLPEDVTAGNSILIDDGLIELEVKEVVNNQDIICKVKNTGTLKDNKGINVPGVKINLPALTEKDRKDIEFGIKMDIDFIAVSFVRKASDVLAIRKILEEKHAEHIQIISKIENQEGLNNLDEILEVSDGLMVARGDLGVEIPGEEMPIVQKNMIKKCNLAGKPVITATQMLDSMIRNPRPTRAEVTDVANAIFDGTDAVMLSGETAAGKYPAEAVKMMASIAIRTEAAIDYRTLLRNRSIEKEMTITNAISLATCIIAMDLEASAIITATSSGHTARMVSKFRPNSIIIAATMDARVRRRLTLSWGTYSVLTDYLESTDNIIELSIEKALEHNMIHRGDLVVITAGVPVGVAGTTNLIKAHVVGDIIVRGTGIGKKTYTGSVTIVDENPESHKKFKPGNVLVSVATDRDLIELMEEAGAVITETGGMTSHAAVVGLTLSKPTIVGVNLATTKLKDGDIVTVDPVTGQVYSGRAKIL